MSIEILRRDFLLGVGAVAMMAAENIVNALEGKKMVSQVKL